MANRNHSRQIAVNAKSIDEVVHLAKIWQVKVFLVFGQKMCQIFMAGVTKICKHKVTLIHHSAKKAAEMHQMHFAVKRNISIFVQWCETQLFLQIIITDYTAAAGCYKNAKL